LFLQRSVLAAGLPLKPGINLQAGAIVWIALV
jgi:hypothetical protein